MYTQPLSLSAADIEALLYALPIVADYPCDTFHQQLINQTNCTTAMNKLRLHSKDFTQNELRVIALSAAMVIEYLAGRLPDLQLDTENVKILKKYFFSYNKLNEYFRPQLDSI